MIETISARWDCKGRKSEKYRLLNMIHAMAGIDARNKNSQWSLRSTSTCDDFVMTTWTNGIVNIKAETYKDDGDEILHVYTMNDASANP